VTLPTSRTALEIGYTGLSFIAPEKIQFKYRLVGFDEDWIDAGTRREAFYTNIPPGEYLFQVLASNSDGVWTEEGPSFDLVVEPPFYRTSLFFAVAVILIMLLGVGVFRIRMKRRVVREKNLEDLVTKRTYQLEEANQALVEMARRDSMTGVANHRHLMERLDEEWRRGIRARTHLSVVMCDIDFFKHYNDRYGHEAGNQCLSTIAQALTEALGRPGDLVARYGGDEFVMILSGSDADGARALAETLPDRIQETRIPHETSPIAEVVTISVGVSTAVPTQEASTGDLISAADAALYEAKNAGRNCVRITDVKVRSSSRGAV
jgi:diguanylate cyclase (GGDEF)-like protein